MNLALRRAARGGMAMLVAALALTSAACSSPPSQAPGRASKDQVTLARRYQLIPLMVRCFVSKHLLTAKDLENDSATPPVPASAWLRDGRVIRNTAFGNWYADKGSAVTVHGKTIDQWVNDAAYDPATWPASICGPRPTVTPTAPTYPTPPF